MDVELADGVTTVRIDHPPVNAFDFGLVEDAVATVHSIEGSTDMPSPAVAYWRWPPTSG